MSQARPDGAAAAPQLRAANSRAASARAARSRTAKIRALYEAGRPVKDIAAATGLSVGMIYYWLDRDVGPNGRASVSPRPRRVNRGERARDVRERRRALVDRLWRAAERQVADIETRLEALGGAPAESERDARALAVLARVLRELSALEAADPSPQAAGAAHEDDGDGPYDLDTFRRELARRLEGLRDQDGGGGAA